MNRALTIGSAVFFLGTSVLLAQTVGETSYETDHRQAVAAFESAQASLNGGELDEAQRLFERADRLASPNSDLKHRAEEHLSYRVPLARVQRLLFTGHTAAAERGLRELLAEHSENPVRKAELEQMIDRLGQSRPLGAPQPAAGGRALLKRLREDMEGYRRANARYPRNRRELLGLLADSEPPFDQYEVVDYASSGTGYTLRLRNKLVPGNVLTLQKTGLMR